MAISGYDEVRSALGNDWHARSAGRTGVGGRQQSAAAVAVFAEYPSGSCVRVDLGQIFQSEQIIVPHGALPDVSSSDKTSTFKSFGHGLSQVFGLHAMQSDIDLSGLGR